MSTNQPALENLILELLAAPRRYQLLGFFDGTLTHAIRSRLPQDQSPLPHNIMSAVWSLVSQRLAYIDYSDNNIESWTLYPTEAGSAAARDEMVNPDNSDKYLENLRTSVPQANEIILQYAREALTTYKAQCYLASSVMLGVASEAAFLDMARSFGNWLQSETEKQKFIDVLEKPRTSYIAKFIEFRNKIEKYKTQIPEDFADSMALNLDSVLDLLRIYRNEAGHATGKKVTRDDVFINLQMFARYLKKLYALKDYFDQANQRNTQNVGVKAS